MVLDASALVELVLDTPTGQVVASRIADPKEGLHVPHLADIEVVQALRRYVREGDIDADAAETALDDLRAFDLQRHAHEPLLERVWELRKNLTAYDSVYVALAEVLDGVLLTCDRRLSHAPGMSRPSGCGIWRSKPSRTRPAVPSVTLDYHSKWNPRRRRGMGCVEVISSPGVVRGDVHRRLAASVVDFLTRRLPK